MATIRPIPRAVHSTMRSGTVLFDLTRVVEELIYNSLDAGAKKVSVCVGIRNCYVKVVDDGSGIARDGLMLLGEKYATSKMKSLADTDAINTSFGFRGEALGSISDVSVLEIITKTHGRPNGYRKVIKGCKCLYLGVDDSRQDVGTTVTVRDLYYNQPVRRKHMQHSPRKVLHSVKKCVLRIALMQPNIYFTVVDSESEELLFSTQPSTSPLPLLVKNFGAETCENLIEFSNTDGMSGLSGYISGPQDTYSRKALQFVYINSRYVGKCLVHKLLNELASRFAYPDELTVKKRSKAQANPSYILNVTCPRSFYDLSLEPSHTSVEFKDWSSLLAFIERTIMKFWHKTHSGILSRTPAAFEEGDAHMSLEEDLRTQIHAVEDLCWTENAKSNMEFYTKKAIKKQHSDSPNTPSFGSEIIINDNEKQHSVRGFLFSEKCPSWDYDMESKSSKEGIDDYRCPGDDIFFLEDTSQLYCSYSAEKEKSSVEDYPSRVDGDFFQARPNINNKSGGKVPCDVNFEFGNNTSDFSYKPWLQSCSTKASTSFDRFSYANDDVKDIFRVKRNYASPPDRMEATQDECYKKSKFTGSAKIDPITNVFSCLPDRINSRYETQRQYVDLVDMVDGVTDDCLRTDNFVPRTLWQVDPVSDFLSPRRKRLCRLDRDLMPNSSEDRPRAVRKLDISCGSDIDIAGFGDENWSFDIQTPNSICEVRFGHSRESSDQPSFEPEAECKKGAYHGSSMCREVLDVLIDHDTCLGDIKEKCYDPSLESENFKYFNREAPKYFDRLYQDDYWSAEYENLFSNDVNHCYNSCIPDSFRAHSRFQSSFNDSPPSSSHFDYEECGMQYPVDVRYCREKRRSRSAPPIFRRKKKFLTLSDCKSYKKSSDSKTPIISSPNQGASHPHFMPIRAEDLFDDGSQTKSKQEMTLVVHQIQKKKLKTSQDHSVLYSSFEDFREAQVSSDSGMKWRDSCPISAVELSRNFHENKSHDQPNILDVSSEILHLSADFLVPECITKECLMDAKVLQQVDKKFIPIVGGGILAVIDQHAADERIKLEELRHKVLSGEVKMTTYLNEEQAMELPEAGYQLLHKYAVQIENWGWICDVHAQASDSFTKNMNLLHTSSTKAILLGVPCILGVSLSDIDLLEYLQQLADTDGSSTIPPAIIRILNSKACRGAIMFGDTLLPSECSLLVEELKNTLLCFQCAHGRPTTAPLVDLKALHKQIAKLPTSNGEPHDSWHGLYRHQISLERVEKRLSHSRN
uniref:DNA mismatch repair protein MLH3 n=1 Tax=Kalanchoe fedtschenkoi TaxID=63787 RepID=A0A7N0UV75_KALFE